MIKIHFIVCTIKMTILLFIMISMPFLIFAKEIHVSVNGNNSNDGSKERPIRNIQVALDMMSIGDVCIVHNGIYRENIKINKSGEFSQPIIIKAAEGEKPVISGLDILNLSWNSTEQKGVFVANYKNNLIEQLFLNNKPLLEARWPNVPKNNNGDWNFFSPNAWAIVDSTGNHYGTVKDSRLAETGWDINGAKAVLNVCHQFYTWTRMVTGYTPKTDTFNYPKDLGKSIKAKDESGASLAFNDDRYYLVGKKEFLDVPGEWYYDKDQQKLYLYTFDGNSPISGSLEVKTRYFALTADENANFLIIDGLTFYGTAFKIGKDYNKRNTNIIFRNNQILYSSYTDYFSSEGDDIKSKLDKNFPVINADYATIVNNVFAYGTLNALLVNGKYALIENNLFHDFDLSSSLTSPILEVNKSWQGYVSKGGNAIVRYNTLYNSGGILTQICQNDNDVYLNDLYNAFRTSWGGNKDASALYTQNVFCHGTRFHHNWVHEGYAGNPPLEWGGGMGVRGDDKTVGLTIDHNVVWNIGSVGINIKSPENPTSDQINKVYNNTIFKHSKYNNVKSGMIIQTNGGQNKYSFVSNNLSETIYGHWFGKPLDTLAEYSNNFTGENVENILENIEYFDFRPKRRALLVINRGKFLSGFTNSMFESAPDIGAYEIGDSIYWIPGRREIKATSPIVPDGSIVGIQRDILMWKPAYNAVEHQVYFGTTKEQLTLKITLKGDRNVYNLPELTEGQKYYWRVDAKTSNGEIVKGDVWSFNVKK